MSNTTKPGSIWMRKGERYVATVLHVLEKDALGRPKKCEMLYDEETIHLKGGEQFLIIYAKEDCVAPETKASA